MERFDLKTNVFNLSTLCSIIGKFYNTESKNEYDYANLSIISQHIAFCKI